MTRQSRLIGADASVSAQTEPPEALYISWYADEPLAGALAEVMPDGFDDYILYAAEVSLGNDYEIRGCSREASCEEYLQRSAGSHREATKLHSALQEPNALGPESLSLSFDHGRNCEKAF